MYTDKIFTMSKYSFVVLQLAVVGISVWSVYGLTKEEEAIIIEMLQPVMVGCIHECGLKSDIKPSKEGGNCLKKCTLKELGVLTEDDKYDGNVVKTHILFTADNEEIAKKHQAILDDCLKGQDLDLKHDKDDEKKVDIVFECFMKVRQS